VSSSNPPTIEERKAEAAVVIPVRPKLKKCFGPCQIRVEFDNAGEHFDLDSKSKDGFKRICKACRAEQRLVKKIQARNRRLEHIDQRIVGLLNQAKPGGSSIPHIAEVFSEITALMGGTKGLAMAVVQTYVQAPAGSPTRQKMLAHILQVAKNTTESGAAKVPLELLDEDELQAEIIRRDKLRNVAPVPLIAAFPVIDADDDDDLDLVDSTEDDDAEDNG
jgi:hypothetical protein